MVIGAKVERALGAGVAGSISQGKEIALRLQGWKGAVEEGRANGLNTGQEIIWEGWESKEWVGDKAVTDMIDKWQEASSLELWETRAFEKQKNKNKNKAGTAGTLAENQEM